jgi:type I restriction enzyme S subunit
METVQPRLRFKEFKGDWVANKVGKIADVTAGGTPSTLKKEYWDGDIRWMNSGDLNLKRVCEVANRITELGLTKSSTKFIPKHSILIGLAGQGKTRGTTAMNMVELCVNQSIGAILPNRDLYVPDFLYHNLDNRYDELRKLSTGDGGRGGLNLQIIKTLDIILPSLPEQTKIANFVSDIDEKINLLKEKKSLLEEYKKGIMQKIFNQKIRFKDDNGNNYEDWEENKFSKYIKLYRGSSPRPIVKYVTKSENGVNWIKIGDTKGVDNFKIENVSEKITLDGAKHSRKVEIGEIILANSMSFGKSYILNISGCIYDGWFVLREYEEVFNKMFLIQLLNSDYLQEQYNTLSTGGVVQNISSEIVYSTFLLKPSIDEQTKIANFFSSIDEKIELVNTQIQDTQEYKKGLLQQMFI